MKTDLLIMCWRMVSMAGLNLKRALFIDDLAGRRVARRSALHKEARRGSRQAADKEKRPARVERCCGC